MAGTCDEEMDLVSFVDALKLDIINIQLEGHAPVDRAIGIQRFKAVESDQEHGHDASCSYAAVRLCGRANPSVVLNSAGAAITLYGEAEERHGEVVLISAVEKGVVAYACEEFIFIPDDLGTCKVIGAADFGDRRGAPGGVDGVTVLAAGYFRCLVGVLPTVDEGSA